jgi:uncharacterized protein
MKATKTINIVNCPCCKKLVNWVAEEQYKPFCSERCQLIDLGDWATECFRIPDQSVLVDEWRFEDSYPETGVKKH